MWDIRLFFRDIFGFLLHLGSKSEVWKASGDERAALIGKDVAVQNSKMAAQIDPGDAAFHSKAFIGAVIYVGDLIGACDDVLARRVIDHDIRVAAFGNDALARPDAVELGRIGAKDLRHLFKADAAGTDAIGIEQNASGLYAGQAAGDLGEVSPAGILLLEGKGAVIGGHRLHRAVCNRPGKV